MRDPELSKEFLFEQYITFGKNRYEISRETGVNPVRIGTLLQKYGIRRYEVQRHGLCWHPLNIIWCGLKERCTNPNASSYKWYGGRGITICDEWSDFLKFYNWAIDNGWEPGLSIDRIDVDAGYSPDNCRFVPMQQQFRNRRSNVLITVDGIAHLQCEWEEILGLPRKRIAKWKYTHGEDYVVQRIHEEIMKRDSQRCSH